MTTATKLADRFTGTEGRRALRECLLRQTLVRGTPDAVDELLKASVIEEFEPGAIVIQQGGIDNGIFFILAGSVVVSPNERADTVRHAGSHVGEMACIDPSTRRSATVRALEETVVAHVSEAEFSTIANAHPEMWRHLACELGMRLRQRVEKVPRKAPTPCVFIASSSETAKIALDFQSLIRKPAFHVHIWTDGIFKPGLTNIEALEAELKRADFAAIVLSSDDLVESRGVTSVAPRDNVILELGLFVGALGRRRAVMLCPQGVPLKIPTDMLGVTPVIYDPSDLHNAAKEFVALVEELGSK